MDITINAISVWYDNVIYRENAERIDFLNVAHFMNENVSISVIVSMVVR